MSRRLAMIMLISFTAGVAAAAEDPPDVPDRLRGTEIGVALSGGGHRATAWALGGLLALGDVGHNRAVTVMASVSGGSLANAYFAQHSTAFNRMSAEEVERSIAAFATQLAGNPTSWATGMVGLVVANIGWIAALALRRERAKRWWFPFVLSAVGVAWGMAFGLRSGGTLWSWWGTWVYAGAVGPAGALVGYVFFSKLRSSLRLSLSVIVAALFLLLIGQRHVIAGIALDSAVRQALQKSSPVETRLYRTSRLLSGINGNPLHIFCATELHTGVHVYFARDFVYSRGFGVGTPDGLMLRTAVQASANFPGAFPPRIVDARQFRFRFGEQRSRRWMLLTDGGVYDNMSTSWFTEVVVRRTDLLRQGRSVNELHDKIARPLMSDEWLTSTRHEWAPKERPENKRVFVLNASPAFTWRDLPAAWIPGMGELVSFGDVVLTMYNNILRSRYALARYDPLKLDYKAALPEPLLLDIGSMPSDDPEAWQMHDVYGWTARPLLQYLVSGDPNQRPLTKVPDETKARWTEIREANSRIGTHLNPLGERSVAELMYHSYMLTLAQLHLFYAAPLIEPRPDLDRFSRIARGETSQTRSRHWIMQRGARYRLD